MSLLSRLKRDDSDREPAVFVVGMNRSGTTLLRMMLDAHPQLTIPPETHFVPDLIKAAREPEATPESALAAMKSVREWGDFGFSDEQMLTRLRALPKLRPGPAVRTFYEAYMEEQGKPRWGEKTPTYVQKMKLIQRALPEARFVHVIRDGRDVALSVLDRTVRELTAGDIAKRWRKKIGKAREDSPKLEHYLEIRYEDLILETEPVLRRVSEFIDLPWDDSMLAYHERSGERLQEMARALPGDGRANELSVERRMATHAMTTKPPSVDRVARWRTQMTAEQRAEFEAVAGELLEELGYPTGPTAAERATAQIEHASA
jgi:Sulfotransferase family